jgi:HD-GYP domain-containing protein (c-di-GMP phosphodiesterase class II)
MEQSQALEIITSEVDIKWDKDVVNALVQAVK